MICMLFQRQNINKTNVNLNECDLTSPVCVQFSLGWTTNNFAPTCCGFVCHFMAPNSDKKNRSKDLEKAKRFRLGANHVELHWTISPAIFNHCPGVPHGPEPGNPIRSIRDGARIFTSFYHVTGWPLWIILQTGTASENNEQWTSRSVAMDEICPSHLSLRVFSTWLTEWVLRPNVIESLTSY